MFVSLPLEIVQQLSPEDALVLSHMTALAHMSDTETFAAKVPEAILRIAARAGTKKPSEKLKLKIVRSMIRLEQLGYFTSGVDSTSWVAGEQIVSLKGHVKNIDRNPSYAITTNDPSIWTKNGLVDVINFSRGAIQRDRHRSFNFIEYQQDLHAGRRIIDWKIIPSIALNGASGGRHGTVGSYEHMIRYDSQPNFFHYIVLDIDEDDIVDCFDTATRTVKTLVSHGCDPSQLICAYTGNKGFHIHIPSGMLGNPIFQNNRAPRAMLSTLSLDVLSESYDAGLYSPFHMHRLIGSQHEKTGRYKVAWRADEFLKLSLQHIIAASNTHNPFEIDNPTEVSLVPELLKKLSITMGEFKIKKKSEIKAFGYGSIIEIIERGIEEGEQFDMERGHIGRNKAMYIYACYSLQESNMNFAKAMEMMQTVNTRFKPPLPRKELGSCLASANRKLLKSR